MTHDCSVEAAGLDIRGHFIAACRMLLAPKQVYIQRTFCASFPDFFFQLTCYFSGASKDVISQNF